MKPGHGIPADLSLLSGMAPELAAAFVSLASDIALVIDESGVIRSVVTGNAGPAANGWVGRPWVDTVTGETRRKIELLLEEVGSAGITRRREVNHPSPGAPDIPIAYTAVRLGVGGPVLAVGRDLRAVAAIQQRFVDAQQEMEREYWRVRQAQSRQRLLDQVARDAVMVIDAQTLAPLECNRAAVALFGVDTPLPVAMQELLVMARSTDRAAEVRSRLASGEFVELSATPFRVVADERSQRLLVRARLAHDEVPVADADAVVVTDSAGRVLMANAAFDLLSRDGSATSGRLLAEALGDPQRGIAALLVEVRREGLAVSPALKSGSVSAGLLTLEVTASLIAEGDQECIGLIFRRVHNANLRASDTSRLDDIACALEDLLARVGELPLTDLMAQAAALTERHAVASALQRSEREGSSAASLLGIPDAELRQRVQRLGFDAA